MRMTDANHSAFPESYVGNDIPHEGIGGGLTKREYFAAKAMQALRTHYGWHGIDTGMAASRAVEDADALIAELNKENSND